jgi:hypothetical protein
MSLHQKWKMCVKLLASRRCSQKMFSSCLSMAGLARSGSFKGGREALFDVVVIAQAFIKIPFINRKHFRPSFAPAAAIREKLFLASHRQTASRREKESLKD